MSTQSPEPFLRFSPADQDQIALLLNGQFGDSFRYKLFAYVNRKGDPGGALFLRNLYPSHIKQILVQIKIEILVRPRFRARNGVEHVDVSAEFLR
ncbi:MAG TPA: hypothetical protein VHZ07_25320 [Bryobacteraceae bacterium]|nr:hypothetical protein [Bryobacteraceae bacterium]